MKVRCLPWCFAKGGDMTCRSFSRSARTLNIIFLYLWLPLLGCAVSDQVDNRNFAVDVYSATPNEIQLAQQRARRYWVKNSKRFQNPTRYLAVDTTRVLQGDLIQNLYPKLINSATTGSFFGHSENEQDASCIMIYDTVTNSFVSNSGYISIDLPRLGSVARWDTYMARYIGWAG
jgi:hypothetical protein